jgi:hypothetical protein
MLRMRKNKTLLPDCLVFVVPSPMELQIDLDQPFSYSCTLGWQTLYPNFPVYRAKASRNGNTHLVIRLKRPLGAMQRACLQAALGSDPQRERMNAERIRAGEPHPILFLEKA